MAEIDRLLAVMAKLRDPDGGCPWDREQDFASIAPYTIEEAYEVADAISRRDMEDLRDELGDLLLQVVYHAQMAREQRLFSFDDVAAAIRDKLVRRHPHVFGDAGGRAVSAVRSSWEDAKERERAERRARRSDGAAAVSDDPFDDVPIALPALRRAAKIQGRAERAGLVEPAASELPDDDRLRGELEAVRADRSGERAETRDPAQARDRVGDLLFRVVALARAVDVDPERALAERTQRFVDRVRSRSAD